MLQLFRRKPKTEEQDFVALFKRKHWPFDKNNCAGGITTYELGLHRKAVRILFEDGALVSIL